MYILKISSWYYAHFLYTLNNFILGQSTKIPKVLYFTSTCCLLTPPKKIKY